MKKVMRFPILWIVFCVCLIILVLFFCGFRITYAPRLENSWEAISAFASWFGAIASAVAIFVAIRIPKKIAERQDSISLFEKRYSAYNAFVFLTTVADNFVSADYEAEEFRILLVEVVERFKTFTDGGENYTYKEASDYYRRQIKEAGKIRFLFELTEMEMVMVFLSVFNSFITGALKGKFVSEQEFRDAYKKIENKKIEEKLALQVKTQNM